MKRIAPNLYARGKYGSIYLRRRIPQSLKDAYPPNKTHVLVCLHTTDLRVATKRQSQEEVKIDAEFSQRLAELKKKQSDSRTPTGGPTTPRHHHLVLDLRDRNCPTSGGHFKSGAVHTRKRIRAVNAPIHHANGPPMRAAR